MAVRNIGNEDFPLYIKDSFIKRSKADFVKNVKLGVDFTDYYSYIGVSAYTTPMSIDIIPPGVFITKVIGVIFVNTQLAGFEVIDPKTNEIYQGPKAAFHVLEQLTEGIYVYSSMGMRARSALSYWTDKQRDFYGPDWSGIEKLCFDVAKLSDKVLIESAGWHQYKMSQMREEDWRARARRGEYEFINLMKNHHNPQDGKNWRFILPAQPFSSADNTPVTTIINCHSMVHNHIWTLTVTITEERGDATTVYTRAFDRNKSIGHQDVWVRSMKWAIAIAKATTNNKSAIKYMMDKIMLANDLHKIKQRLQPQVLAAYKQVIPKSLYCYKKRPKFPYITIAVNSWSLQAGKIGMYEHPLSSYADSVPPASWTAANGDISGYYKVTDHKVGILTLNSMIFTPQHSTGKSGVRPTREYIEEIIKHELIHAILDERCSKELHGNDFKAMAQAVGLPDKYWN